MASRCLKPGRIFPCSVKLGNRAGQISTGSACYIVQFGAARLPRRHLAITYDVPGRPHGQTPRWPADYDCCTKERSTTLSIVATTAVTSLAAPPLSHLASFRKNGKSLRFLHFGRKVGRVRRPVPVFWNRVIGFGSGLIRVWSRDFEL